LIIALAARLSVSIADSTPVLRADHSNRGEHSEMRGRSVSLTHEEIKRIDVLRLQSNVSLVDDDGLGDLSMDSSNVDNQLIVHENPDIIISSEGEDLVSSIGELGV